MDINSPQKFAEITKQFSYQDKSVAPLCQYTFFLGAGFSKAWDERFPLASELFHFPEENLYMENNPLSRLLSTLGYLGKDIDLDFLKEIVYRLGMYKKYPEQAP